MPLNGSGGYVAPASTWNPPVTNTAINSTDWTALLADITTALSTAMFKDGQATPTANIGMGGFKITNLAAGTLVSDAARVSQVQNGSFTTLSAVAGTNTVTATATPTPAAYVVGQIFTGIAANTNSGATTLNISSLGAGAVQVAGVALVGGELSASAPFTVVVTAVTPVFQLIASAPFVDSAALVKGSADATKKIRFEVDGLTTGTTRVLTVADVDSAIGKQPTRQVLTSGSGTYTTPAGATRLSVRTVGAGGGGAGSGTTATSGGNGGNTTFSTLSAGGGTGGNQFNPSGGGTPANGDINIVGSIGGAGNNITNSVQGGNGGAGPWGGLGSGGSPNVAGNAAAANSGAGGGGGGGGVGVISGAGGSSGGYVEKLITAPAATYSYGVGAAGTAGTAGTSGVVGGAGGSGLIIVDEYYN